MNFDFPTMPTAPTVTINKTKNANNANLIKKIESEMSRIFKQAKSPGKFYLIQIGESYVRIEEFYENSSFCCTTDLLCEAYTDLNGQPIFSYLKLDRVKLSNHLLNLG